MQLAIQSQSFRPQDLRRGVLIRELSKWIPKGHLDEIKARGLSNFYVERRIYAGYEQVKDLSTSDATFAYLKAVKDLPLYGSTIFNVSLNGQARVLGVAEVSWKHPVGNKTNKSNNTGWTAHLCGYCSKVAVFHSERRDCESPKVTREKQNETKKREKLIFLGTDTSSLRMRILQR